MDYDSPYYVTIYQVITGHVTGVKVFQNKDGADKVSLKGGDYFTVVLAVNKQLEIWYRKDKGWYEIPAIFCFGDGAAQCLKRAMNASAKYRRPYLFRPTSLEKHIPFIVPFLAFKYIETGGNTFPETGMVHPEFKNFDYLGARYDSTSGELAGFHAKSSFHVGKVSAISFSRKKGQLEHQPLTECYLVEWAHDGCAPGLDHLMKGWDMKKLKMKPARWLKDFEFPLNKDEDYLQPLNFFERGKKTFLVPKGLVLTSNDVGSEPYSHVYESVQEQVKGTLHTFGLGYQEETSGAVYGSAKVESYSKFFTGNSYASAVAGVNYKLFTARFLNSFNFGDKKNWDDRFEKDLNAILGSRNSAQATDFFNEYGTHYIKEAVLGGRKESVFSVDYCSVAKSSSIRANFEADLKLMYKGVHETSMKSVYEETLKKAVKDKVVSGPSTTCLGGNSLTVEVCENDTRWRDTVHIAPSPIELTVEPFWKLPSDKKQQDWLKSEYEKYLVAPLGEKVIKQELKISAHCDGGVLKACQTAVISAAVALIVSIL